LFLSPLIGLLRLFGPALAAILVTAATEGRSGVGDYEMAQACGEECLALYRELDDADGIASCLKVRAV
jgi:hypothetical protein